MILIGIFGMNALKATKCSTNNQMRLIECIHSMSFIWLASIHVFNYFCSALLSFLPGFFFIHCQLVVCVSEFKGKYCCTTYSHNNASSYIRLFPMYRCEYKLNVFKLNWIKLNFMQNTRACLPHQHTHTHTYARIIVVIGAIVVVVFWISWLLDIWHFMCIQNLTTSCMH